jgi:hypothetical protein
VSTLDPGVRLAFTDALRPPPGYVLAAGYGTAFSLEFDAFTAVALAFVGADLEGEHPDPPSVLTAIARLRTRLRVFINGGGLLSPRQPHRLFALYDRVLRPVPLEGSAFHPKVWVMAFEPQERPELHGLPRRYRFLCSSRNVTDSHCWELGARFDGEQGRPSPLGADLRAFGEHLGKVHRHPPAIQRLLAELRTVEWEHGGEAAELLRLHFQWPREGTLAAKLPRRAERGLVISPFVRAEALADLVGRFDHLTLVSTQEELDALSDAAHDRLAAVTKYVVTGVGTDEIPALSLHAKLVAWEQGATRETLIGSANATGPGWAFNGRGNCEAMLALRPGLSIDGMVKAFVAPDRDNVHPWIEKYLRVPREEDEADQAKRQLERLKRELAGLRVNGHYDRAAQVLTLTAKGPIPKAVAPLLEGVTATIAPLLRSEGDDAWRPVAALFESGAGFQQMGLGRLCAFAVVSLKARRLEKPLAFCLQFDLPLPAEDEAARDNALHAELLASFDPHALLLNVLQGLPAGSGHGLPRGGSPSAGASRGTFLAKATIERVMEACTADRSRIDEVDALLTACRDAPGMKEFVAFWAELKSVLVEEAPRG